MFRARRSRLASILAAVALLVLVPATAFADRYRVDHDPVAVGLQHVVSLSAQAGDRVTTSGLIVVERSAANNLPPGEVVTFSVQRVSNRPPDFVAPPVRFTVPSSWGANQRATVPYQLSFTAPLDHGDHAIVVDWAPVADYGNRLTGGEPLVIKLRVASTSTPPAPPDSSAPILLPTFSSAANALGWFRAPVTVGWSAVDAESGIASSTGCGSTTVSLETAGLDLTCAATNGDGLSSTSTVVVRLDSTNPTVSAARTAANASGWTNSPVTVTFTCADALSGIATCADPRTVDVEGANQSVTGGASDRAGNTGSVTLGGINVDFTAPTMVGAVDRAPNAAGWYNAPVTVTFDCSDALSGVARCTPATVLASDGVDQSVAGSTADRAGNPNAALVSDIDIDGTVPIVGFNGNAALYTVDQDVAITCAASDELSGLASSQCPVAAGPAYGFPLGVTVLNASAIDRAGNSAGAQSRFEVRVTYTSLCALTQRFVTRAGIASSLCSKLRSAEAADARGATSALAGLKGAYSREISAQTGKSITAGNAAILLRLAAAL